MGIKERRFIMKTEAVKISQFKCLKDFEAHINGAHILLVGENGLGKSSFMQFIQIALGNTDVIPEGAVGGGEVIMSKDGKEYTFKVKFKDGKPQLSVTTPDGIRDTRKGAIASIVGANSFNIDKFVELSKTKEGRKKQVDYFKSRLPQEVLEVINKHEMKAKNSYDDRTEINRDIVKLKGKIESHPLYNEQMMLDKYQLIDVSSFNETISKASKHNENVTKGESALSSYKESVSKIEEQIRVLMKEKEAAEIQMKEIQAWLDKNKRIDISEVQAEADKAMEHNNKAKLAAELKADIKKLQELEEDSGNLTALIDSSKQAISDTIKQMDSPVEGLEFNDDTLVYNGVPVTPDNLSTSEIIELGVKMKMAENPELGVLFIEHGESIGTERLNHIKEIADNAGWQIIMEQVQRGQNELLIEKM